MVPFFFVGEQQQFSAGHAVDKGILPAASVCVAFGSHWKLWVIGCQHKISHKDVSSIFPGAGVVSLGILNQCSIHYDLKVGTPAHVKKHRDSTTTPSVHSLVMTVSSAKVGILCVSYRRT